MIQDRFHSTDSSAASEKGLSPASSLPDSLCPTITLAVTAVAAPLFLAGCGSGGGGGGGNNGGGEDGGNNGGGGNGEGDGSGPSSKTLTFTSIQLRVATDSPTAAVTINGTIQAPAPSTTPLVFPLNGAPLAADPGKKGATLSYTLLAHVADGVTDQEYVVTINPAVSTLIPAIGSTRFKEAKHLAARTGFGASLDDLLVLSGKTHNEAVDFMVDNMRTEALQDPLPWYRDIIEDDMSDYRREMIVWWMREIITTPTPFTERMVTFWSNHFVVNIDDIDLPHISWAWQDFLRKNVSGNLRTFAHDMCLHPAMMRYLDNENNEKVAPPGSAPGTPETLPSNENFGRELLELFLLGEGKVYKEADVIQVARAFTGHNLGDDDEEYEYVFYPERHDKSNDMVILGKPPAQYGGKAGDVYDIIDVILEARVKAGDPPRTAQLVVEKLWAEFIGTTPTSAQVNALALVLYNNKWELKPLYKALFKHSEFLVNSTARKMLKSPLELICGFHRSLGQLPANDDRWNDLVRDAGDQDQEPFAPPNVKGWLGGVTWINAKTLLERFDHLSRYGRDLEDKLLPLSLKNGYTDVLLNEPRVTPVNPVPSSESGNPLSWNIADLIKDPSYNLK